MNDMPHGEDPVTKSVPDCKRLSHRVLTMSTGIVGYE